MPQFQAAFHPLHGTLHPTAPSFPYAPALACLFLRDIKYAGGNIGPDQGLLLTPLAHFNAVEANRPPPVSLNILQKGQEIVVAPFQNQFQGHFGIPLFSQPAAEADLLQVDARLSGTGVQFGNQGVLLRLPGHHLLVLCQLFRQKAGLLFGLFQVRQHHLRLPAGRPFPLQGGPGVPVSFNLHVQQED
ncbi:hypothetical protein PTH_1152 [Pelotomaculum thermopropionicum SI]|uniref:Uncharacterized protein n=1 Tax=Pelotomaculum thermopropionicum (strain DSM 13744 / JCM 10971 / SI) TaxID=370438 RepID=A5D360_PELTS|nr:hypothetical protein PTH_1152 [Pelotomaculum thermopropionicum SI]